jgi:rod shape-determining protein MreC
MKRTKTQIIILSIITTCLVLTAFHFFGWTGLGERYITRILANFFYPLRQAGIALGSFLHVYASNGDLTEANDELRERMISLARENVRLKSMEEENLILKKELQFIEGSRGNYVLSRVLGSDMNYDNSTIVIDKGSSSGVKEGLAVIANGGVLIGVVIKAEDSLSQVRLLNDNDSKISALVKASKSNLGVLKGDHNLNLKIDNLPRDAQIGINDLVSTAGLEINIPGGLLIGEIENIFSDDNKSVWLYARVRALVDYEKLSLVTIILP